MLPDSPQGIASDCEALDKESKGPWNTGDFLIMPDKAYDPERKK